MANLTKEEVTSIVFKQQYPSADDGDIKILHNSNKKDQIEIDISFHGEFSSQEAVELTNELDQVVKEIRRLCNHKAIRG